MRPSWARRSVTAVRIGDRKLTPDDALGILRDYAQRRASTVLWYDLAGDEGGHPGPGGAADPVNAVSLADTGRLVVINAGLSSGDVPALLSAATSADFAAVPAGARLEDWAHGGPLDSAVTALYDLFRVDGIGPAKRSKLLHLKRPWLVPIYDSHLEKIYKAQSAAAGAELGDAAAGWWEAPRRDLVDGAGDFAWLSAALSADDDAQVRRAGRLTALRLLDILAWRIGGNGN